MAGSINKVILLGRLGGDPEIRVSQDGNKIAKFEVDSFKKKCLMEGLDDIALSMEKISQIDNFEKKIKIDKPWLLNND